MIFSKKTGEKPKQEDISKEQDLNTSDIQDVEILDAEPKKAENANGENEDSRASDSKKSDKAKKNEDPDYEKQYAEMFDRYQRSLAEFDNFRKRTTKEKSAMYDEGVRAMAEKMLPVLDNFERALSASENKDDNFYQGVAMIARQLENVLTDMGIEQIAAFNESFDPNLHYAVAHTEDDSMEANVITEEMQKGYKHKDKVIRPSMVKVAN